MPKQGKHDLLMQELLTIWNEKAKENGWCRCRTLNEDRKRRLRAAAEHDTTAMVEIYKEMQEID